MWIPVLVYHRVTNEVSAASAGLSISPHAFERQMSFLYQHGFSVAPLEQVVEAMRGQTKLPPKSVAITFDDGYRDTYSSAVPILKRYGFHITAFIVSSLIGRTNEWDRDIPGMRPVSLLTSREIREMATMGVAVGAHSRTHPRLPLVPDDRLVSEVTGSKTDLEDLLGVPVNLFCYPHYATDDRVRRLVAASGYRGACGGNGLEDHVFNIPRIDCSHDSLPLLYLKVSGVYQQLRRNSLLRAARTATSPATVSSGRGAITTTRG